MAAEWGELALRSGNVFATPEWDEVWWRHFGEGLRRELALLRAPDGAPLALHFALRARDRAPCAWHGSPATAPPMSRARCAPRPTRAAAALVLSGSGRQLGWDLLLAERLPPGHRVAGRVLAEESSPVVAVPPGGFEEYMASRSRNFRSQARRKERALERDHGLSFRLSDDPARLDEDFGTLVRLHRERWGDEGSGAFSPAREAFHRDFAAVAQERGWLRLWIAEADGRPVAAWYGLRYGRAESYYQSGRDPEWERSSVGLVLLVHTIREAMGDGMQEYRLLRGGETYKDRFATDDPGVVTVAAGRGASGRAAAAAGAAALRLPEPLRRRAVAAMG